MSKIEEEKERIVEARRKVAQERAQRDESAKEEKEADRICQTIYEDGVAVVRQYYQPKVATRESIRERLGAALERINPFYVKRFRRDMEVPVVEEGQPSVYIHLREHGDANSQRLDMWIQEYGQRLRTESDGGWNIMIIDTYWGSRDNSYKRLYKGRDYDPLKEAQGWREVMDTVLKLRPIHTGQLYNRCQMEK